MNIYNLKNQLPNESYRLFDGHGGFIVDNRGAV